MPPPYAYVERRPHHPAPPAARRGGRGPRTTGQAPRIRRSDSAPGLTPGPRTGRGDGARTGDTPGHPPVVKRTSVQRTPRGAFLENSTVDLQHMRSVYLPVDLSGRGTHGAELRPNDHATCAEQAAAHTPFGGRSHNTRTGAYGLRMIIRTTRVRGRRVRGLVQTLVQRRAVRPSESRSHALGPMTLWGLSQCLTEAHRRHDGAFSSPAAYAVRCVVLRGIPPWRYVMAIKGE